MRLRSNLRPRLDKGFGFRPNKNPGVEKPDNGDTPPNGPLCEILRTDTFTLTLVVAKRALRSAWWAGWDEFGNGNHSGRLTVLNAACGVTN